METQNSTKSKVSQTQTKRIRFGSYPPESGSVAVHRGYSKVDAITSERSDIKNLKGGSMKKDELIAKVIGFILGVLVALLFSYIYTVSRKNLTQYNAHVCAVYGKEPDCKTPLPEHRRLQ